MHAHRRALVMHHDADLRNRIEQSLIDVGWDVFQAVDRADALPMLYRVHPDLILMQVNADHPEGGEDFSRIRFFTDSPIILLADRVPWANCRLPSPSNAIMLLEPTSVELAVALALTCDSRTSELASAG